MMSSGRCDVVMKVLKFTPQKMLKKCIAFAYKKALQKELHIAPFVEQF